MRESQAQGAHREGFTRRRAVGAALALAVTLAASVIGTGGVAHAQGDATNGNELIAIGGDMSPSGDSQC